MRETPSSGDSWIPRFGRRGSLTTTTSRAIVLAALFAALGACGEGSNSDEGSGAAGGGEPGGSVEGDSGAAGTGAVSAEGIGGGAVGSEAADGGAIGAGEATGGSGATGSGGTGSDAIGTGAAGTGASGTGATGSGGAGGGSPTSGNGASSGSGMTQGAGGTLAGTGGVTGDAPGGLGGVGMTATSGAAGAMGSVSNAGSGAVGTSGEGGAGGSGGMGGAGTAGTNEGTSGAGGDGGSEAWPTGVVPLMFTRLTIQASGGMPLSPDDSGCPSYVHMVSIERETRLLTWNRCSAETAGEVVQYSRVLTELEFQAVVNTASLIVLSDSDSCGYDKEDITLDVEVDGATTRYDDDFYACHDPTGEAIFVRNIDKLTSSLWAGASRSELPPFEGEIVGYATPVRNPDPDPSSTCSGGWDEFALDIATRTLTWEFCSAPTGSSLYALESGSRELTDAELDTLRDEYAALQLGASKPCPALPLPNYTNLPEIRTSPEYTTIIDEVESCVERDRGRYYAPGLVEFYEHLAALAE